MTKKMLAVAALAGVAVLAGCGSHTEETVVTGDVTTGAEVVEMMTGDEMAVEATSGDEMTVATTGDEVAGATTGDFVVEATAQ